MWERLYIKTVFPSIGTGGAKLKNQLKIDQFFHKIIETLAVSEARTRFGHI